MRPSPTLPALALLACGGSPTIDRAAPLRSVPQRQAFVLPALQHEAHVVFTEAGVPHVYAADRRDLAVVWGFQAARDRYFMMDLSRRLALGELSALLGDAALSADMESRAEGNRHIAGQMLALTEDHHPELVPLLDAYAEGINAWIDAVGRGEALPPSELTLAAGLLGAEDPTELLEPWDRLDVVACGATVLAQSGFSGGDVGRGLGAATLETWATGKDHAERRREGFAGDVWGRVEPVFYRASAPDWDPAGTGPQASPPPEASDLPVPSEAVRRILRRRDRWDRLRGHDWEHGFGSNAWAVGGGHTADGRALLAGDGHLALTIPPLFWQVGLDTALLGDPEDALIFSGMAVPGLPVPGPGTNGHVAWSQIAVYGDVIDWYLEEIRLDAAGRPVESRFQGAWEPLAAFEETAAVADVPALDSVGRTETWSRWTTFDGRWIVDVEGQLLAEGEPAPDDAAVVRMGGDRVIPGDTDGDGRITAISFDYAPLDGSGALVGLWGFADARDVDDFHQATRDLVGNAAGLVVADRHGSILYTGHQAVPCRSYLDRTADGAWAPGADPFALIDGTRYGGFTIPFTDGHVDHGFTDDPARCLVPFLETPWSRDPTQGYLVAANNDPGGQSFDGDLTNDGWYVGGPWLEGYRADTISRELEAHIADGEADLEAMQQVQANHDSRLGEQFVPQLLDALDRAEGLATRDDREPDEARLAALWADDADRFSEVRQRLQDWADGGYQARSGVDTFYDPLLPGDEADSVATMIFNAWYGRFLQQILADEGFPRGAFAPTGDSGRQRLMKRIFLEVREGRRDPETLASYSPETGESVFFDVDGTPEHETADELQLRALTEALDFLAGRPDGDGRGGFGTDDMDAWRWGLRHWVRFESVLAEFLGDDPTFAGLTAPFAISPQRIPVADGLRPGDPRGDLPGFPRHGDQLNVDAANPGTSGTRFHYGSGPVFRLAVALGPDGPEGVNVLPGGQSALVDSPHFDDQARLWLGNDTLPLRWGVDQVVEGATGRDVFRPE